MFVPQSSRIMNAPRPQGRGSGDIVKGPCRPRRKGFEPDVRDRESPEGLSPTPTDEDLKRRFADFATMPEALDYAAQGERGLNFHDARGSLITVYPYSQLRRDALRAAHRLIARGVRPGERIALVAETAPEFAALFFGALYARAWPVPLPLPTSFGGRDAYVGQLATQLKSSDPKQFYYPGDLATFATEAASLAGVEAMAWESLAALDS